MGLFSSKKKTYVDSVTYNLSGGYSDRMNYLPTIVVGAALNSSSSNYMGETVLNGMLNGTSKNQVNLLRWAKKNYAEAIPTTTVGNTASLTREPIEEFIQTLETKKVSLKSTDAELSNIYYWAKKYVLEKYGQVSDDDWIYDISSKSGNKTIIQIAYKENPSEKFTVEDFVPNSLYLYTQYYVGHEETSIKTNEDGSTETVVSFIPEYVKMYIYRYGTGNSLLDSTNPVSSRTSNNFMPFMPIRVDNKFISDLPHDQYYNKTKKFYKKATGKKIDKFIKQLNENEKIGDIDFAYIVYGVALNTKRQSCKRYIYEFFKYMYNIQGNQLFSYNSWIKAQEEASDAYTKLKENAEDNSDNGGLSVKEERDLWNTVNNVPSMPAISINLSTNWLNEFYRISVQWSAITVRNLTGDKNPKKKINEVWITSEKNMAIKTPDFSPAGHDSDARYEWDNQEIPSFTVTKQVSESMAIEYTVIGLAQTNHVYKGKTVEITADKALADKDECSLLIPMHLGVLKNLPLKHRNQVCTEDMYIIFNCYKVVKQKWYQTGIFKILVGLIIAISSVFFAPAGSLGFGILGSNLAVGTALGIGSSVLVSAIVGSIVNAIAAMIVSTILTKVLNTVFKGTFGAIFSAVFGLILGNIGNLFNGGSLGAMFGQIFNPRNILNLTQTAFKCVNGVIQGNLEKLQQQTQQMMDSYNRQNDEINAKMSALKGNNGTINTAAIISNSDNLVTLNESSETFLRRTLLTLCDIVELDKAHISNTIATTQELPQAFA